MAAIICASFRFNRFVFADHQATNESGVVLPPSTSAFNALQNSIVLSRFSSSSDGLLPYDAADTYLLRVTEEYLRDDKAIFIVGDNFGALSLPLIKKRGNADEVYCYSDSYLSTQAIIKNAEQNQLAQPTFIHDVDKTLEIKPNLIVGRVPKSKAQLSYLLSRLHQFASNNCVLLLGGMDKHLSKGLFDLLAKHFGTSEFLPGIKKARVWRAKIDKRLKQSPHATFISHYYVEQLKGELCSLPNVFSREKLDMGSRFLIDNILKLPMTTRMNNIADVACGNGVLGISYLHARASSPEHHSDGVNCLFCDESYQAIQSTTINLEKLLPNTTAKTTLHVNNGLSQQSNGSLDLIICNPPFHQQNTVTRDIAFALFRDFRRCLTDKGECWLVVNRHLGHHATLRKIFGNCRVVADNNKYLILRAVKRTRN